MPKLPKHNTLKCNDILEASHKHISMMNRGRPLSPSAWHGQTLALPVPSKGLQFLKVDEPEKPGKPKQKILVKHVNNTELVYLY